MPDKNTIMYNLKGNASVSIPSGTKYVLLMAVATSNSSGASVSVSGSNYISSTLLMSQTIGLTSLSSTYCYLYRINLSGAAGTLNISVSRTSNAGLYASTFSLIY